MDEIWKRIPIFTDYEASNLGRIRSVERWVRAGKFGRRRQPEKIKVAYKTNSGYMAVKLSMGVNRSVHVLIAAAWIGPRPKGFDINHRDGVKTNNRPENLEYVTRSENALHSYRNGLQVSPSGEGHYRSAVSAEQVAAMRQIRSRHPHRASGVVGFLARWFNLSQPAVSAICNGRNWKSNRKEV